ncbi:MAG: hypothetical protein KA257_13430 [Opitutaceae bacterium]|jgi:hypothetical protein|nr:hypothetical protein [Opitutaceae bacterium]MBP9914019.1 hypothetical protein [Opitutaceae bacterium]
MSKLCGLSFILFAFCGQLLAAIQAPGDGDIGFSEAIGALIQGLVDAEKFEIHEGLPRTSETKLFATERKTKTTVQIDGEWFYATLQEGRLEDVSTLKSLFLGSDLFRPWAGMKLCDGFHADYAVRFKSDKSIYTVLFCFNCHEARIMRESRLFQGDIRVPDFRLTTDLDSEKFGQLQTLLLKYRKERSAPLVQPSGS